MKAFGLKRVVPPPPPPVKVCMACNAFRAECVVPVGEASAPMCWLCAHHVVEHECPLHETMNAECECLPHEIYPGREPPAYLGDGDVVTRPYHVHGDVTREMIEGATKEELLRGSRFSDYCAGIVREAVANMSPKQRAQLGQGTMRVTLAPRTDSYVGTMKGLPPVKIWVDASAPVAPVAQDRAGRKAPKLP